MFPHQFTWGFLCPCFRRIVQDSRLRCPGGQTGAVGLVGEPTCRRPVLPVSAQPLRCAPPRPDPPVVYLGFGFDRKPFINRVLCSCIGLHGNSCVRAPEDSVSCPQRPGVQKGRLFLGQHGRVRREPSRQHFPASPCPDLLRFAALQCLAPSRPARGMSGLGIR